MPTKIEKDAISGRETTGHDWDGLQELDTPLPRWWLYTFVACCIIALIQMVLFPSFPYGPGYFRGLLGASSRDAVAVDVQAMAAKRSVFMDQIKAMPIDRVKDDPQLMAVASTAGRITFATNCQPCHGPGGEGRTGYPSLADDTWIWGGKLADLQQTIAYGIRSGDDRARSSAMPRFGGLLKPDQIEAVTDYVWIDLYGHGTQGTDVSKGREVYGEACAACHGVNGEGNRMFGAPPLKSAVHLYADTRETILSQVTNPHQGVMPNWNTRLDDATIKSVALYVHSLGGGE